MFYWNFNWCDINRPHLPLMWCVFTLEENLSPAATSAWPAVSASCSPSVERSTSTQPQNLWAHSYTICIPIVYHLYTKELGHQVRFSATVIFKAKRTPHPCPRPELNTRYIVLNVFRDSDCVLLSTPVKSLKIFCSILSNVICHSFNCNVALT